MNKQKGVLSPEYHNEREKKLAPKYRLFRRTREVLEAIRRYKGDKIDSLCDIGTADALMLDMLDQNLNIKTAVGLDFSIDLLKASTNQELHLVQGDAVELPFKNNSFDVVVATAVIEHVPDAGKMLRECYRVLKEDGLCIITSPDPFFEHIATKVGYLDTEQHQKTFTLAELKLLFELQGFKIIKAEKFMMSPVGFPYEVKIEKIMRSIGLGFLLLNQLVVGLKID